MNKKVSKTKFNLIVDLVTMYICNFEVLFKKILYLISMIFTQRKIINQQNVISYAIPGHRTNLLRRRIISITVDNHQLVFRHVIQLSRSYRLENTPV